MIYTENINIPDFEHKNGNTCIHPPSDVYSKSSIAPLSDPFCNLIKFFSVVFL